MNSAQRQTSRQPSESNDAPVHGIKYSIIVPAYNSETTLGRCLDSLSHQTVSRGEYEIIVVDDGSTDGTSAVARRPDIRYLRQSNRGPAAARNQGAATANGWIILFTDSDCAPAVDWLGEMVSPFDDRSVAAVKGAYRTEQTKLMARFAQMEFEDRYDLLRKSSVIDMVDTYSAAFQKSVFLQSGGFDSRFSEANNEDTDLSYRLSTAGHKMIFNPQAIVYHRHPDSPGKYLRTKLWRAYWRMIVYRRFPQKAVRDSYTPNVLKLQTMLMAGSFPFLCLAILRPAMLWPVFALWSVILASSLPFSIKTFHRDRAVGLIAPLVVLLRSMVFALGSLLGLAGSFSPRFRICPEIRTRKPEDRKTGPE